MLFFTPQLGEDALLVGNDDLYQVVRVNYGKRVVDLALPRNGTTILKNVPFRELKKRSRHVTLLRWLTKDFANESLKGRLGMIITVPLCIGLILLVELKRFLVPPPEVILKQMSAGEFLVDIESLVEKVLSRQTSLRDGK